MNIEDIKRIEFIYTGLTNQFIQEVIFTVATANDYKFTITQPALDASGNTITEIVDYYDELTDTSGTTENIVYETIENPVNIVDFAQDIIDKQLQAYVINCKKKIAERELQNTMSEFRTTIINIKSNTD
jgi:hypothetical protein